MEHFSITMMMRSKKEASAFIKIGYSLKMVFIYFGDLQGRTVNYHFIGYSREGKNLPQETRSAFLIRRQDFRGN